MPMILSWGPAETPDMAKQAAHLLHRLEDATPVDDRHGTPGL